MTWEIFLLQSQTLALVVSRSGGGDQDYKPNCRAVVLETSGVCSCLHVVPSEMVPPRRGVIHLHGAAGPRRVQAVVLLEGAVQSSNFAGRQVRCCMLGMMMVSWKCQGYPKQLGLFILFVCIQCSVPALMCVMKICQWRCDSHPTLCPLFAHP